MPPAIQTKLEKPSGLVNGTNDTFETSLDYEPDTLRVWLNGALLRGDWDDGFTQLYHKEFRMKIPPRVGDKLSVFYLERTTSY